MELDVISLKIDDKNEQEAKKAHFRIDEQKISILFLKAWST